MPMQQTYHKKYFDYKIKCKKDGQEEFNEYSGCIVLPPDRWCLDSAAEEDLIKIARLPIDFYKDDFEFLHLDESI